MDSLQGIQVEYELDTFNTPPQQQFYVTPKIGYVNAMLLFRSLNLVLNSALGHFNGDQRTPLHQTHETHGDDKSSFPPTATWLSLNYSEHNPSHGRRRAFLNFLISPFRLYTHNIVYETSSTNTNYIFHAANKNHS